VASGVGMGLALLQPWLGVLFMICTIVFSPFLLPHLLVFLLNSPACIFPSFSFPIHQQKRCRVDN